jgi:hypothetical protein
MTAWRLCGELGGGGAMAVAVAADDAAAADDADVDAGAITRARRKCLCCSRCWVLPLSRDFSLGSPVLSPSSLSLSLRPASLPLAPYRLHLSLSRALSLSRSLPSPFPFSRPPTLLRTAASSCPPPPRSPLTAQSPWPRSSPPTTRRAVWCTWQPRVPALTCWRPCWCLEWTWQATGATAACCSQRCRRTTCKTCSCWHRPWQREVADAGDAGGAGGAVVLMAVVVLVLTRLVLVQVQALTVVVVVVV